MSEGHGTLTGIAGDLWNGRYSETPLASVKEAMAGAEASATVWEEAGPGPVTEAGLVPGTRTVDGKQTGSGTGTERQVGAGDVARVPAGAAAGFKDFGCPKIEADAGPASAGRWAGISRGWLGLEAVALSCSKGLQMPLAIGGGDSLGAESGACTGTEAGKDTGTGSFAGETAIAFSIRLCTLEGSMTC